MEFVEFVKHHQRDLHDAVPRAVLERASKALERSGNLVTLLNEDDPALELVPPGLLPRIADVQRAYADWREAAKEVRRNLAQSQVPMPDGGLDMAYNRLELSALERAARMCPRSGFPDHVAWGQGVKAHVELWRASLELAIRNGTAQVTMAEPEHEEAAELVGLLTQKAMLGEIRGYKWLATRRGARSGVLGVKISLPWEEIFDQTTARLQSLGLPATRRGAQSVIDELIKQDLPVAVTLVLDQRAEREAMETAREAYLGLLRTPPLVADGVLSLFIGKPEAATGWAVLDKNGEVREQGEIPIDSDLVTAVQDLIAQHPVEAAAIPISASDSDRLRVVERAVGGVSRLVRVHGVALGEARSRLPFPAMSASAVVLARRAIRPAREWGRVDPLLLGLGEYPRDLDPEKLKRVLAEAKATASWERRRASKASSPKAVLAAARAQAMAPRRHLNPLVKGIADLKPGMIIDGVITNVTRFGAFVNIGLQVEAMIHVSQLAHEFVEEPAKVVRVGQEVSAKVLEVDPAKARIALSLKAMLPTHAETILGSMPRRNQAPPKSRDAALADLDALFKK